MIKKCYPDFCMDSVFSIDKDFYKKNNIKAVIFDIDNTLVKHTDKKPTKDVLEYFEFLDSIGVKKGIISNNKKERVELFCQGLDIPYEYRAFKPRKKPLKKLLSAFGVDAGSVLFVGDQLFTDIFGANRMGFVSVVVTAMGENETGFVAFKRIFENLIMKSYLKSKNKVKK